MAIIMTSHHALLYIDTDLSEQAVAPEVELVAITVEQFGIDDARRLKDLAYQSGSTGERCFKITARSLTSQAQNALLRLCEDPPDGVRFMLSVPTAGALIDTLRSRFELVEAEKKSDYDPSVAKDFLALTLAERLTMIADKTKAKDEAWQQDLRRGLEVGLPKGNIATEAALVFASTNASVPGASQKMLLEHLALAIAENRK